MKMKFETIRKGSILTVSLISMLSMLAGCSGGASDAASVAADMPSSSATASSPAYTEKSMAKNMATNAPASPMVGGKVSADSAKAASFRAPAAPEQQARQVIRKAELDVRVGNVEKAEKAVGEIVQSLGGYTETASSTDLASAHPVLNISLRVPVGGFDSAIARFEALGVRLSKKVGSEDVTGQLVDLDARLKTLKAQEDVYRNMLKNRSQLDEVFNIQNQLTQVRTQIEQITGERKSQAGLAAMSTIALTLEQNAVANMPSTDPNWLAQTWAEASSGASTALRIFVVAMVWILAFSPFWIPAILLIRRALKPVIDKKAAIPPAGF